MAMPISGEMANGPCKSARAGRPDFRLLHSLHSVRVLRGLAQHARWMPQVTSVAVSPSVAH